MQAHEMIRTHPHVKGSTDALIHCIAECLDCARICTSCTDACLGEPMVRQLTRSIRPNMNRADLCNAIGMIATRPTGSNQEAIRRLLDACMIARIRGDECERRAGTHDHCRICAEACRRGERPACPAPSRIPYRYAPTVCAGACARCIDNSARPMRGMRMSV